MVFNQNPGTFILFSPSNNKVATVEGAAQFAEAQIVLEASGRSFERPEQQWNIEDAGEGLYKIISVNSGMLLSLRLSQIRDLSSFLCQRPYNEEYDLGQMWAIDEGENGGYVIYCPITTPSDRSKMLTALQKENGDTLWAIPELEPPSFSQRWSITKL